MKLKKCLIPISLLFAVNNAGATGIPVVDSLQITTDINNQIQTWTLEAQRWVERINAIQQDFKNQQMQLAAITGVANIDSFINDAGAILNQVTDLDSWIVNSDVILANGKSVLSGDLQKIFDGYGLTQLCNNYENLVQQNQCEGEIIIDVVKQAQNEKKIKVIKQRVNTINNIANKMKVAATSKEAQDLNNAMNTQIALLQADKLQADSEVSTEKLNESLLKKKEEERIRINTHNIKQPF